MECSRWTPFDHQRHLVSVSIVDVDPWSLAWIKLSGKLLHTHTHTPGLIEVTNESHENPAEHQYVVSIDDVTEELMACTCPHHIHRNAFCKHMAAVENATDDGTLNAFPSEDEDDTNPEDCDCDGLNGFPCWPCVRTGRKELPN
ncbi:hypothetical protein BG842_06580 [Haladaptatus sp. W1]|nr:SWIM zinc finger family protein [Haladaptatus sp. W1]ODR79565.1 hypothetical protein BG842_06580 [Haladaptatus sp. W1]